MATCLAGTVTMFTREETFLIKHQTKKLCLAFLLCFTAVAFAFGQNPKREVVFTMNANEEVVKYKGYYEYYEYYLLQTENQNRFACMVGDTLSNEITFVFNGKRINKIEQENNLDFDDDLDSFDVTKDNGYVFIYKENGKMYVNYNGVVDGGFEDISLGGRTQNGFIITTEKGYDYLYKLANRWYAHKNGENKLIEFIESSDKVNESYVNINGNISGPYGEVGPEMGLTKSGKYAYSYSENGKWYVNINGNISAPYDGVVCDLKLTENGKYVYCYGKDKKCYINNNGNISAPYDDVYGLTITESGKYAYNYQDNGNEYVAINGNVNGPYEVIDRTMRITCLTITESGKYAYNYRENGEEYANINGNISGSYDYVWGLTLTENGKYAYNYRKDRKDYVNINGSINYDNHLNIIEKNENGDIVQKQWWSTPFGDNELEPNSSNNKHSLVSSPDYEYVVIDGRPYGKAHATNAWYDDNKNAFIWTAIEGKELVVYEYKLD